MMYRIVNRAQRYYRPLLQKTTTPIKKDKIIIGWHVNDLALVIKDDTVLIGDSCPDKPWYVNAQPATIDDIIFVAKDEPFFTKVLKDELEDLSIVVQNPIGGPHLCFYDENNQYAKMELPVGAYDKISSKFRTSDIIEIPFQVKHDAGGFIAEIFQYNCTKLVDMDDLQIESILDVIKITEFLGVKFV